MDQRQRRQPHVLLFPYPGEGHINPFLDLGRRLSASGIVSTLLLTPACYLRHSQQQQQQLLHHRLLRLHALHNFPPHVDDAILSSAPPSPDLFTTINDHLRTNLRTFLRLSHSPLLDHLHPATHDDANDDDDDDGADDDDDDDDDDAAAHSTTPPISCLVSDNFMAWTVDVAADFHLDCVTMWTASATTYLFGASARQLISMGLLPFKPGTEDVPLDFLPANISTSRLGHLPVSILSIDSLSHPRLQSFLGVFDSGAKFDRVLVNSFQELEAAAIDALKALKNVRMTAIGPTLAAADQRNTVGHECRAPLDEAQVECLRWLDKQEPKSVVYVAFGSSGILSEDEVREVAAALDAVGQPFLWALRKGSATGALPENLGSGKGLVVPWAPQRQVLGHESVAAFVSHCGWNSVLESIWSAVPIVACPRLAEQNTNMWLLQEWGVGVPGVDTIMGGIGSIRSATLARALQDVIMGGPSSKAASLRRRAAEMAAAAHAAVSESGSSTVAFQEFVNELLLVGC